MFVTTYNYADAILALLAPQIVATQLAKLFQFCEKTNMNDIIDIIAARLYGQQTPNPVVNPFPHYLAGDLEVRSEDVRQSAKHPSFVMCNAFVTGVNADRECVQYLRGLQRSGYKNLFNDEDVLHYIFAAFEEPVHELGSKEAFDFAAKRFLKKTKCSPHYCLICGTPDHIEHGPEPVQQPCLYPFCKTVGHTIAACPVMMHQCERCKYWGHMENHHTTYSLLELISVFHALRSFHCLMWRTMEKSLILITHRIEDATVLLPKQVDVPEGELTIPFRAIRPLKKSPRKRNN